jgi:hypothetical protein
VGCVPNPTQEGEACGEDGEGSCCNGTCCAAGGSCVDGICQTPEVCEGGCDPNETCCNGTCCGECRVCSKVLGCVPDPSREGMTCGEGGGGICCRDCFDPCLPAGTACEPVGCSSDSCEICCNGWDRTSGGGLACV